MNKENRIVKHCLINIIDTITCNVAQIDNSVTIQGKVMGDLDNENTLFNDLYLFFQHIMNECHQKNLLWNLNEKSYLILFKN